MKRIDAILTIIGECRKERVSTASEKRQIKALKVLGLEGDDLKLALRYLDIVSSTGDPFNKAITRDW